MRGGRGGRRKSLGNYRPQRKTAVPSSSSPPPSDKEEEEEEDRMNYSGEEEENNDREYDEEDEEEEEEQEEEGPKLADGFYEIEDIRKRRTYRGQTQYLIKWRGWPETANTWEPIGNLGSCSDLIDAFEHRSSRSSKKGKRKLKPGNSYTPLKRKKLSSAASTSLAAQPASNGPAISNPAEGIQAETFSGQVAEGLLPETGHANNSGVENQIEETNEGNPESNQEKHPDEMNAGNFTIQMPDNGVQEKDDQPKDESHLTGAKRRKSGRVSRFRPDSEEVVRPVTVTPEVTHQSPLLEPSENAASDEHTCPPAIVQIVKPLRYSTSVSGNVQNVSVTFLALRSDGQQTEVDNKFLKDNYHQLLIDFYEQHLRCNCPA